MTTWQSIPLSSRNMFADYLPSNKSLRRTHTLEQQYGQFTTQEFSNSEKSDYSEIMHGVEKPMVALNKDKDDNIGVCFACHHYYPLYGGASTRFRRYAPGLLQRGVRMDVFTQAVTNELADRKGLLKSSVSGNCTRQYSDEEWPLFEIIDGIQIERTHIPRGLARWTVFYRSLAKYCKQRRQNIDVVNFLNLSPLAAPWINQIHRMGIGTVVVCTIIGELSSNPLKRALQRIDRKIPYNLADCVVAGSGIMREYLEEIGVTKPILVIPHGVNLQKFRPLEDITTKTYLRQKLGLGSNWEIILSIGAISSRKGIDVLVKAFLRLLHERPDVHLLLIGPQTHSDGSSVDKFLKNLHELIDKGDAQDRVHFLVAESNIEDYLRASDLFVLASRREGMPNSVIEAMACGLPVIMTPFIGLCGELGTPGIHYILADWNPESLVKHILGLLGESDFRTGLSRNARTWVESNLDVNHSLDAYASLYRELADMRKVSTPKGQ